MQKNSCNKHHTKHNHDKRFTCCPLKMLCAGTFLKNPDLDIGKKINNKSNENKNKLSSYWWPLLFMNLLIVYSNKKIVYL